MTEKSMFDQGVELICQGLRMVLANQGMSATISTASHNLQEAAMAVQAAQAAPIPAAPVVPEVSKVDTTKKTTQKAKSEKIVVTYDMCKESLLKLPVAKAKEILSSFNIDKLSKLVADKYEEFYNAIKVVQ